MSYDVSLKNNNGAVVAVTSHNNGGTVCVGSSSEAAMSVTYNYADIYALVDFDLWGFDGMSAKDSIPILDKLVEKFGTKQYKDYWAATPGNAGAALSVMLEWAKKYPEAVWSIT
jgi:hypothetical protein